VAALEFWQLVGRKNAQKNGIDFLGWDFAFNVNEIAAQFLAANKVHTALKNSARSVGEKAVKSGDIKFYELAALTVKVKTRWR
jgi:hypothetical protein